MEPILIDLNDYVRTGEGANGASYNHKTDPSIMMKLYLRNFESARTELEMAKKVFAMGIPSPEPGDLVTDGERLGIRFRRIDGKKSYSRACGDNLERCEEYAREFAQLCIKLHNIHVDTTKFENVKDRQYRWLQENPFFTDEEKAKLHAFIAAAPDTDTAIHGDLQFSNGIFVEDSVDNNDNKIVNRKLSTRQYFIDLGDFCYGYPMFDLGMVYLCCCLNDEAWTMEQYHMSNATAACFWDAFADEYFHSPDCPIAGCGPNVDMEAIEKTVRVYAGLKTLLIESCTHRPMPEFRAVLAENILK